MSWLFLTLANVLLMSIASITLRTFLKDVKFNVFIFSLLFQLLTGVFLTFSVFAQGQLDSIDIKGVEFNAILMGVLYGFGNVFAFKSIQNNSPSFFAIGFAFRGIIMLFASVLFLGEGLYGVQILGLILILASIVIVNISRNGLKLGKNYFWIILAAVFFGLAFTNDRYLLLNMDINDYLVLAYIMPGVIMIPFSLNKIKEVKPLLNLRSFAQMSVMAVIHTFGTITMMTAMQQVDAGPKVVAVSLLSTVTTVIFSIVVFKEKEKLIQKILGAVISVIGLLLIS